MLKSRISAKDELTIHVRPIYRWWVFVIEFLMVCQVTKLIFSFKHCHEVIGIFRFPRIHHILIHRNPISTLRCTQWLLARIWRNHPIHSFPNFYNFPGLGYERCRRVHHSGSRNTLSRCGVKTRLYSSHWLKGWICNLDVNLEPPYIN